MSRHVRWTELAVADMDGIADYLSEEQPTAFEPQLELIWQAANTLQFFPRRGRPGRIAGSRELVIPGTPYVLAYAEQEQTVEVLAVLHGARRRSKSFSDSRLH